MTTDFIHHIQQLTGQYRGADPWRLRLGTKGLTRDEAEAVATQLELAPKLQRKLPEWAAAGCYLPSALSLEQCSSGESARYKQRFVRATDRVMDLTGGLGVDFVALASVASEGIYIERLPNLVSASQVNFPRLLPTSKYHIHEGQSHEQLPALLESYRPSLIYLDPARRESGDGERRVYAIEDCEPNLLELLPQLRRLRQSLALEELRLVVKLSPMLDVLHTLRAVAGTSELHIVSVRGEVKELLLYLDLSADASETPSPEAVTIVATDLHPQWGERSFAVPRALATEESLPAVYAPSIATELGEPHAALMKSGLYRTIAERTHSLPLHPNSHLYTAETLVGFPGRRFRVVKVYAWASSVLKRLGREIGPAEITCRNFPLGAEALRKKLRLSAGGNQTLLATTLRDGEQVLILCQRIE